MRPLHAALLLLLVAPAAHAAAQVDASGEPPGPREERSEPPSSGEGEGGAMGEQRSGPPAPEAPADTIAFDLTAGTHFPVSLGADAHLEIPYRILFALHLGWMPPAYVDVINGVSTAAGWYDPQVATLVSAALEGAFVMRLAVGFRPLEDEGFEIHAGYSLIAAGGSVTSAEAVQAATGQQVDRDGTRAVPVRATLHALHATVGWRFVIEDHFVIRAQIGWVHTVYSETVIDVGRDRPGGPVDQAEAYLDGILQTYAFSPEVRLAAGYRF